MTISCGGTVVQEAEMAFTTIRTGFLRLTNFGEMPTQTYETETNTFYDFTFFIDRHPTEESAFFKKMSAVRVIVEAR